VTHRPQYVDGCQTVDMSDAYGYDVVFLALARDCATTIPGFLKGLESLQEAGLRVRALVGENGSSDNTRALLNSAAASEGTVEVLDTGFMSDVKDRMQRMAVARQFLAEQVKKLSGGVRVIGVIDMDEPFMEHLDPDVLKSVLSRLQSEDGIFALSATSIPTYYDLLAFEDGSRAFTYLEKRIQSLRSNPVAYYRLFRDVIYSEQDDLTSRSDIRCRSAFNGLALYKSEAYALGTYLAQAPSDWICEHVTFNRSVGAATGQPMIIDASLILPMPAEHGRKTLPGFVWQRTSKLPKKIAARIGRG
jgi:hypothetical protein